MDLFVSHCAAWGPGLETAEEWAENVEAPLIADSNAMPGARAVPAMTRRRLTRWGRLALEVATELDGYLAADAPVIFSSRHGDTHRTEKLLRDLAREEPLSPTAFSLSVHNAALGLFTIIRQIKTPSLALAAGRDTLAQAWLEAASWLHQGASQVLLVHADEPLADFYREDADEAEFPAAVALLLSAQPSPGARRVSLDMGALPDGLGQSSTGSTAADSTTESSMMTAFLVWWFGADSRLEFTTDRLSWTWERELQGQGASA